MPEVCKCGHLLDSHPTKMSKGDPERFFPPLPETRCATTGCACSHYDEDRAAITDSERLMRIEDMLQQVLRKLQ